MQYTLLFLEGIITFISPCLLPMLPVYVSYFAADGASGRRVLTNALGFVLGFTLVFVTLGAFAGTVGRLLSEFQTAVNIVTGSIVILLGLNVMEVINLGIFGRGSGSFATAKDMSFLSALIFGAAFSVSWTPCVGAFLGSALMMASRSGGVLSGVFMLLVYSLGLGLPFIVCAVFINKLKGAFAFIKRHYKTINVVSGGILVAVGLAMAFGLLGRLLAMLS